MTALPPGYTVEIDSVEASAWYEHMARFRDASLYQVWHQGTDGQRFVGVSRLLMKDRGEIVAAAEVRLFRVPLLRSGIAYVLWGPLWRRREVGFDPRVFRLAMRALRNEYVSGRGMVLRVAPRLFLGEDEQCRTILAEEGFSEVAHSTQKKTLRLALGPELSELRKGFWPKWRNRLNKAEKAGLTVEVGTHAGLFDEFKSLYAQMIRRKAFVPTADIEKHCRIQAALPEHLKMGVVVARGEGGACAGAVYSAVGDAGLYLFGATNETGMQTGAAYVVQWELLRALKGLGSKEYDLHGINPESNPGTYHFKKGLAGDGGIEATFIGQFQALETSVTNRSLLLVDGLRHRLRARRARRAQVAS